MVFLPAQAVAAISIGLVKLKVPQAICVCMERTLITKQVVCTEYQGSRRALSAFVECMR